MGQRWRKFAPYVLYFAGLALLVGLGFLIVMQQFSLGAQISFGVAVLSLAVSILLDPDRVRIALTGRQARYGSNALILSIAFLGIAIVANYIVFNNDQRWDLTEGQENSLAPETIETLGRLSAPVHALAFFTSQNPSTATSEDLLKRYVLNADGNFTYEVIDPLADPIAAEQANVTKDGDIVLQLGDRQEKAGFASEQELTGAIVRLMSTGTKTVYFLSGHGEYDPLSVSERSYSQIKSIMESKNYSVQQLNLLTSDSIPVDANAIVVAGSTQPLLDNEVNLIKAFVGQGGNLFVLVDPVIFSDGEELQDPLITYLEDSLGVVLNDDLIIDMVGQQQFGQPLLAVGAAYSSHPITQGLGNIVTVFPQSRSISIKEAASGVSPQEIVYTTDQSWAEMDLEGLTAGGQPQPDEGVDQFGPLALMVAVEDFNTQARVVVIGDSDFIANENARVYGNSDLFINSIDWVVGQDELIQLTPKPVQQRSLNLPPVPYIIGLIVLLAIFVIPGSVLAVGIGMAVSRRKRL